jgi:hypothetical protein
MIVKGFILYWARYSMYVSTVAHTLFTPVFIGAVHVMIPNIHQSTQFYGQYKYNVYLYAFQYIFCSSVQFHTLQVIWKGKTMKIHLLVFCKSTVFPTSQFLILFQIWIYDSKY